jgi:hypothetical protein
MRYRRPGLRRRKQSIAQERLQQNRSHLSGAQNRHFLFRIETLHHANYSQRKVASNQKSLEYTAFALKL